MIVRTKTALAAVTLIIGATSGYAQAMDEKASLLASMAEMRTLVAAASPSRDYLSCATMSANLDMMDMYGLFIRKAAESTKDPIALALAVSYMSGFTENEIMHIKGSEGSADSKRTGELLGTLYSMKCMKYIMPK